MCNHPDRRPMLSADGSTLYIDKDKILKPWEDHFDNVLNHTSSISDADIATHYATGDDLSDSRATWLFGRGERTSYLE